MVTRWTRVGRDLPVCRGPSRAKMEFSAMHGIWEVSVSTAFEFGDLVEARVGTGFCLACTIEAIRSSCGASSVVQRLWRILADLAPERNSLKRLQKIN